MSNDLIRKDRQSELTPKPKNFIENYSTEVEQLLGLVGVEVGDASLDEIVEKSQPFAMGDHYDPSTKLNLGREKSKELRELADKMGMLGEVKPIVGRYDRIVLLGGEQKSSQQRLDYMLNKIEEGEIGLAEGTSLVLLGGKRNLKGREILPLVEDLAHVDKNNGWVARQMNLDMTEAMTEDAALRLATMARLGEMTLRQAHLRLADESDGLEKVVGKDLITHRVFSSSTVPNILAINSPSIHRPLGPARHTTVSSVHEWLKRDEIPEAARVLFVSSNPYIPRTYRNFMNNTLSARPDLEIVACGPSAVEDELLDNRILGEVARNLYEDLQAKS